MMDLIKLESFKEENFIKIAEEIAADVISGDSNPLFYYIQAMALEKLAKEVKSRVKDFATDEASNYNKVDSVFNGAKFSVSQSPTSLHYNSDDEYRRLENELKARKEKLKEAFDMKQKGNVLIDKVTGEEIPVVPIKKFSEQTIKVTFK
jgi:hypothetical protein